MALAINPSTPNTLYAGTYEQGVFQSTDSGGSWSAVSSGLSGNALDVLALAIDPITPSTFYAATGGGVFQSTDSGGSWSAVNTGLSGNALDVLALAIDPITPNTLYVGTDWAGVFDIELICGNGALDSGEQCDDGNLVNGDGCSAQCTIEPGFFCTDQPSRCTKLIPGQGKNACMLEWFTEPVTVIGRNGLPTHQLACTDDNPLCDFGATTGDEACTYHVALCFNVAEQRFACTPTNVETVQLTQPSETKPADAVAAANRDALEAALTGLGGAMRGSCTNKGPHQGQFCAASADCDSTPGSGNGRCKGRFMAFVPPLSTTNACMQFANIRVPLGNHGAARGARTLRLGARPSKDPITGKKRLSDSDWLTLICKPHR